MTWDYKEKYYLLGVLIGLILGYVARYHIDRYQYQTIQQERQIKKIQEERNSVGHKDIIQIIQKRKDGSKINLLEKQLKPGTLAEIKIEILEE